MSIMRRAGFFLLLAAAACAPDFESERKIPARGTLGQELYGALCDRVGAQSLREDLTGESYDDVCHPNAQGGYADAVDRALLPAVFGAPDTQGSSHTRERGVSRVEALAEQRDELAAAFDAMLPDRELPASSCGAAEPIRLFDALRSSLSQLVPLYEDETVPRMTRALGTLAQSAISDVALNRALSRLDARQGYRPEALAMYVLRPILSYPRLFELGGTLATVHRENRHGARSALAYLLKASGKSLADSAATPWLTSVPLSLSIDPLTGRSTPSRARSLREVSLSILSAEMEGPNTSLVSIVRRDTRGVAEVLKRDGVLPFPFVSDTEGRPAIDELGRFVTLDGRKPPYPFAARAEALTARDSAGLALADDGMPFYQYYDVSRSVLGEVSRSFAPLFVKPSGQGREAAFDALALRPALFGPTRVDRGTQRFDASQAPLVDLAHALGASLARPEMDDLLKLLSELGKDRPDVLARAVRLGLSLDAIADQYPNVSLPKSSTLWDELLDVLPKILQNEGLLEDILKALTAKETAELGPVFASYMRYRDDITYYRDDKNPDSFESLNGKVYNRSAGDFSDMHTPVDRNAPDSGLNRSILQRFLSLLHDANGLSACSKADAVAHVDITWPPGGAGLPIKLDYPTNPLAKTLCAFLGSRAPDRIPECGILRLDNVADLIVDVVLGKAEIEVRDDCLGKLMRSPLARVVGGPEKFLEDVSGIRGFNLDPTVAGVARLAFFDAPYSTWGGYDGDKYYPKTSRFLKDVLAPVPSMVCPEELYTDPIDGKVVKLRRCERFEDTLRGRDPNGLFPLEQLGFLEKVIPLAKAFGDHEATPLFVSLLDVLHRHWGDALQSRLECDPSLPKSHARYCTQDGVVAYEPMLATMLDEGGLLRELGSLLTVLAERRVQHCDEYDDAGSCLKASERDGIVVLSEAARGLMDPQRNYGLTDRRGEVHAARNDGTFHAQTTPLLLWLDGFARMDAAFAKTPDAQARWRSARSALVDTFLRVEPSGESPRFAIQANDVVLPHVLELAREQVTAHCRQQSACAWAQKDIAQTTAEWLTEATTFELFATLDALTQDDDARTELGKFLSYLLGPGSDSITQLSTSAALLDLLQVLDDEDSLRPTLGWLARAVSGEGEPVGYQGALAPALLDVLARFFDSQAQAGCTSIDPHHAFAFALSRAVTPPAAGEAAPLEIMFDALYRVNRVDPRSHDAFAPEDFASLAKEMSALLLDEASGLEQIYTIVRQASERTP